MHSAPHYPYLPFRRSLSCSRSLQLSRPSPWRSRAPVLICSLFSFTLRAFCSHPRHLAWSILALRHETPCALGHWQAPQASFDLAAVGCRLIPLQCCWRPKGCSLSMITALTFPLFTCKASLLVIFTLSHHDEDQAVVHYHASSTSSSMRFVVCICVSNPEFGCNNQHAAPL